MPPRRARPAALQRSYRITSRAAAWTVGTVGLKPWLRTAKAARDEAERGLLEMLDETEARQLRALLTRVAARRPRPSW